MAAKIPVPITFNPYKHHFVFLLQEIEYLKERDWPEVNQLMTKIGTNLFDFYIGRLHVDQICSESVFFLEQSGIKNKEDFDKWLSPLAWRKITLSDHSRWLIKKGNNKDRFAHIHPAKFSDHTIRIRANTLKTVLALQLNSVSISEDVHTNLFVVNRIRSEKLKLSPVKSFANNNSGIMRLWKYFTNYPLT